MPRRRKLRNLMPNDADTVTNSACISCSSKLFILIFTTILIFSTYFVSRSDIIQELNEQYDKQYNVLKYGTADYCNQKLNPDILLQPLEKLLLNQHHVLQTLSYVIGNHDELTALALIGGSGIGKSLTAQILKTNFQWSHNAQYFIWSRTMSPRSQQKSIFDLFKNFSKCGHNLLIVDGLQETNDNIVEELFDHLLIQNTKKHFKIIVIFIFNLKTLTEEHIQELHGHTVRLMNLKLSGMYPIIYKSFDENDLRQCIRQESKQFNITLDAEQEMNIIYSIDVKQSGCKMVHKKIALFL